MSFHKYAYFQAVSLVKYRGYSSSSKDISVSKGCWYGFSLLPALFGAFVWT